MSRARKLKILVVTMGLVLMTSGLAAIPSASADTCTLTVGLPTGGTSTLTVDAAPGTSPSSLVPAGDTLISANCTPSTTTTAPSATVTTGSTSVSTPTTTSGSGSGSGSGTTSGSGSTSTSGSSTSSSTTSQSGSSSGSGGSTTTTKSGGSGSFSNSGSTTGNDIKGIGTTATRTTTTAKQKAPVTPQSSGITGPGVPTTSNPTFSFALPGAAPLGVPNFFIDSFEIPPFLLPIYQAAGIEYDVPWQVLAAINEIETDYGRNLSVSSAGAVGWMQFMPSTWKEYGVDATGSGYADPYNPVDAIFAAARYLHAAGASKSVPNAIYSYNHAWWYVKSVLLRAQLIGGMPSKLVGALTDLVEGDFPVAAAAKYADNAVTKLAGRPVKGSNAAITVNSQAGATGTSIFTKQGSAVIAVNDGKIVKIGHNAKLGNYLELQDSTGNTYTYADLGSISKMYPVPNPVKVSAGQIAKELSLPSTPAPNGPATAGQQQAAPTVSVTKASREANKAPISLPVSPSAQANGPSTSIPAPMVKERLFAHPSRPASYAAGGQLQIKNTAPAISNFQNYFSDVLHLGKNQYTLRPLRVGSIVVAGTILGRIGAGTPTLAPHVKFMIRPAGRNAPYIDPKPILDGWKLLQATAIYRAAGVNPFVGRGAKNPSIGQVLLMSKEQLTNRVLADPHVQIYACGQRDIRAGLIDRRILGVIEFLSASGLDPSISGLECGHSLTASNGVDAAGATGASVDISKINGIPVNKHQGKGSITDIAIRRLLTLQGTFRPDEIVSAMQYKGQKNTLSLPDHANRIQVTYTPVFGQNKKLSAQIASLLSPSEWTALINHISNLSEPTVPIAPSQYAIKVPGGG